MPRIRPARLGAALALALIAAPAAAQEVSGDARMGLAFDSAGDARNAARWQMTARARVLFDFARQTDAGLFYGAGFQVDEAAEAAGNTAMTGGYVYLATPGRALVFGNVAGAARHLVGDLSLHSLAGVGDPNEMTYLDRLQHGPDALFVEGFGLPDRRTAARFDARGEGWRVSLSLDQPRRVADIDRPNAAGSGRDLLGAARARGWSLAAAADLGPATLSAGYEALAIRSEADGFRATHVVLGASAPLGPATVTAIWGRAGGDLARWLGDFGFPRDQVGASVAIGLDGLSLTALGNRDLFGTRKAALGARQDLGGGAALVGAVARESPRGGGGRTRADFGVEMSF